jgi:hypothetical protein
MANVLSEEKRQQVLGLGRLGWSLRRIESATGVRRETASGYLRAAGVAVRGRGGTRAAWPPKPAIEDGVSTDFSSEKSVDSNSKPAITGKVSTDPVAGRSPTASACEAYRELIGDALARGRNARAIWQDLVDDHGFGARYASVLRFVRRLRGAPVPEARVVITTAPGEECQVDYGEGPMVRDQATGKRFRRLSGVPPRVTRPNTVARGRWQVCCQPVVRRLGFRCRESE